MIGEIKQEIKRVNVPDIRDLIEFWELREEIIEILADFECLTATQELESMWRNARYIILKIESIGKKENK